MPPDETKPPLKFKKLRIAWSVFWGVACVLLVVLWVRSYHWTTNYWLDSDDPKVQFTSHVVSYSNAFGRLLVTSYPGWMWPHSYGWQSRTYRVDVASENRWKAFVIRSQFEWESTATGWEIKVPDWIFVAVLGCLGLLPWVGCAKRFSLRTLLIAITLVAVVLGAIAYAVR